MKRLGPLLAYTLALCVLGSSELTPVSAETTVPALDPPKTGKRAKADAAVVIGIERYAYLTPVPYARRDAEAFQRFLLNTVGVSSDRVSNLHAREPAKEKILAAVRERAEQVGRGGTLWIYYSGHGSPDKDDALLLGADTQGTAESVKNRSVRRSELLSIASASKAERVIVVFDACFSGKTRGGEALTKLRMFASAKLATAPKVAVFSAVTGEEYSGPFEQARHGLFTYFLIGGLSGWADSDSEIGNGNGNVELGEVDAYVRRAVGSTLSTGDRRQTPELVAPSASRGWVLSSAGKHAGPDLAELSMGGSSGGNDRPSGPTFEVTALSDVPEVQNPSALGAVSMGSVPTDVDVDALEAYDTMVRFDESDASPEEKAKRWQKFGRKVGKFATVAQQREGAWRTYIRENRAAESARKKRAQARDKDWARLSRLLVLKVVPAEDKRKWAKAFVAAYGSSSSDNPHVGKLAPYVDGTWVRIPGGTFQMGSNAGDSDEKPVHAVTVSTFSMARTETTVAEYRKCVEAGTCSAASVVHGKGGEFYNANKSDRANHPINGVNWSQAVTYCEWAGGRLPTEAEWEYAARSGGRDQKYPWGNVEATCDRAVMREGALGCGQNTTGPVCSRARGKSTHGLCDMAGNVWEWVSDRYLGTYYATPEATSANPQGPASGSSRVVRGGSFDDVASALRAAYRGGLDPGVAFSYLGFRCARSSP